MIKKLRLGRAAARLSNYCARMAQPSLTNREKAFTLVELLIVIAIIAILTLAFLPNILKAPAKARDAIRIKQVSDIANSVEVYATEKGNPPEETLGGGTPAVCFMPDLADDLGITAPSDTKKLNSCNPDGTGNEDRFYYRFEDAVSPVFYIVGTKLEASSGANTWAGYTNGGGLSPGTAPADGVPDTISTACSGTDGVSTVTNIDCARALLNTAPDANATEFWRIAVGPQ